MNALPNPCTSTPIIEWSDLDERARDAVLARPAQLADPARSDAVRAIIADVRARGDDALREYSARFDRASLTRFAVSEAEFDAALASLKPELRGAIERAIERIETFHRAQRGKDLICHTARGVRCECIAPETFGHGRTRNQLAALSTGAFLVFI
ncbi:partial Histidinol dehydrogenase, partial [Gammaproteobacteria bacterium]